MSHDGVKDWTESSRFMTRIAQKNLESYLWGAAVLLPGDD